MSGPLYGGNQLAPGILVRAINTSRSHTHGYTEVQLDLLVDPSITDINDLMQKLQFAMRPQPGISMTTTTASSSQMQIQLDDPLPEEVPLPGDEDLNGNGSIDPEEEDLKMLIERRFDEVDQALRLLVDP